ncbi:MAG: hypothetical protein HC800_25015 [Phormidesmis sp. RL_2_1]|nr:hypothetical protein [Phormidesmis sp. RL_2_1]
MENIGDNGIEQEKLPDRVMLRATLSNLFQEYQPSFTSFQWPLENMRWNELVFCILEEYSSAPLAEVAARAMSELDLLDVEKLAQLDEHKLTPTINRAQLILGILREAGFEEKSAKCALTSIVEVAKAVQTKFDGKVQSLLRSQGEYLIQKSTDSLGFSTLDNKSAQQVVTRWLQNILNLPVCLNSKSTQVFCTEMAVSVSDLIATADDLDINLALVDELTQQWCKAKTEADHLASQMLAEEPNAIETHISR